MLWRKLELNWRYAIGEFAIVVLGVLTALWVENWNSERKDRQLEAEYVVALLDDLSKDEFALERNLTITEELVAYIQRTLEIMDGSFEPADAQEIVFAASNASRYTFAAQSRDTYDDLLSTGNLRIIEDDAVRSSISGYYSDWDFRAQWRDNWRSYQTDFLNVLPDVIDPVVRDAVFFEGRETPWTVEEVEFSTVDARELIARFNNHPTMRKALHNMRRAHGLNYDFAKISLDNARALETVLNNYLESL